MLIVHHQLLIQLRGPLAGNEMHGSTMLFEELFSDCNGTANTLFQLEHCTIVWRNAGSVQRFETRFECFTDSCSRLCVAETEERLWDEGI